ncbi:MAG: BREX-1 system adenine-specific DNA-methyltransferase PglX [Herbinix sp.]|nr:BREX-1 system adenine-specific DNA-methyltransferase PglX [Herbinix sp.]
MNKTAIKNFAIRARRKLIDDISYKAGLIGINDKGILEPLPISTDNVQFFDIGTGKPTEITNNEIRQRDSLIKQIIEKESTSDYYTAFLYVMEEVAYTWFNRLTAIRFMEVNDYLPSRIRVLSSEIKGKSEPDMVTTPFDTDMIFTPYETDRIIQLKEENKLDELFRMLFIKQCNKLNEVLPELFEETADYTELLLTISFIDKDGIVSHLVNDIEEKDFTEAVEIIGWMYQYYNTEPKEEVFALLKKNVKITKERIPAATQLFTPDWIVRYMVENSLGRLWVERERAISGASITNEYLDGSYFGWRYYLEEADQEEKVNIELEKIRDGYKELSPEDIKVIDPCMGSGHILVYAFDVLMQIYESQGYTQRDAAQAIIENNLYGLDIDERAYQLAYFAVMMKVRKYDRRFLTRRIVPKVYSIKESNNIQKSALQYVGSSLNELERNAAILQMDYILDVFHDAKEYGSILNIDTCNWELLNRFVDDYRIEGQISLDSISTELTQGKLKVIITIAEAMAQKYDVVVTNPPYMGNGGMNSKISKYVKENYADSKADLFAVFMEKGNHMTKYNGYNCMVTMQSWMFLKSFQKIREDILSTKAINNLMHMENMVMGIAFGTAVTNIRNIRTREYKGTYNHIKLCDIESEQPKQFPVIGNRFTQVSSDNFSKIPGSPIAYWGSSNLIKIFELGKFMNSITEPKVGLQTGDNNRFLRLWNEVDINRISFNSDSIEASLKSKAKWFPYNKGGERRQWYGNYDYVVNWENDGFEIRNFVDDNGKLRSRPQNTDYYFKESITWPLITSSGFSIRYREKGSIYDVSGMSAFTNDHDKLVYLLGVLSTKISNYIFKMLNPTINLQVGDFNSFPVFFNDNEEIRKLVEDSINISKEEWNYFETSWDFRIHSLVKYRAASAYAWGDVKPTSRISSAYKAWSMFTEGQFDKLKSNEEELNRIFINIYGLQDELTPEVDDKDITITRIYDIKEDIPESMKGNNYILTKSDVIKSFISYAVGCMFGRYSLDVEGLAYAGGDWEQSFNEVGKYTTFIPDKDNIIPITDEEYFEDDIVGLFVVFVKKVYGTETLEENLDFIAEALGNKGNTSREIIRNYFIKDFYNDHVKTYKKRPIYWLYDSGKQDGFKALIYLHRYNADTTGIVRVYYLHKIQRIYISEIERMQDMIENSTDNREISKAEKRKEKLIKQYKETKEYDEKIAHVANSRIDIDLDDGVKVNYEKIQIGKDGKKLYVLGKI